jgi:hypothetical protein
MPLAAGLNESRTSGSISFLQIVVFIDFLDPETKTDRLPADLLVGAPVCDGLIIGHL